VAKNGLYRALRPQSTGWIYLELCLGVLRSLRSKPVGIRVRE